MSALGALYFLRVACEVPALVASRANEVRLVHDAPHLGGLPLDIDVILGDADLDVMHVEDDPGLPVIFHHPVPRTPA
jgi:hypothetical protein